MDVLNRRGREEVRGWEGRFSPFNEGNHVVEFLRHQKKKKFPSTVFNQMVKKRKKKSFDYD